MRDEAVERRQAPCELLGSLEVPDWLHVHDGRDIFGIGFHASLGYDESEQLPGWDPKDAFLGVELNLVGLEV